jgi:hypothetical protein
MARLLSEAAAAKVEHIIYVSIVGIDNRVSPTCDGNLRLRT